MKLAWKIILANVLLMLVVLTANAWNRLRRETELFEGDMRRDHRVMGRALANAVAVTWAQDGEADARDLIARANEREAEVGIRWVRLDAPRGSPSGPEVPESAVSPSQLVEGGSVTLRDADGGIGRVVTYVPLPVASAHPVGLELSESLRKEKEYMRTTVVHAILVTGLLALLSFAMAMVVGIWLVGRPMRQLIAKAQRIGTGDFGAPLELRRRDELGELAREMNAMSERLVEANERIRAETVARIAALEQLRHADRLSIVGKLASGVAHEVGTPLNVVAERARMIATREVEGDDVLENARIVADQAGRITRIIRELLDFARPRSPHRLPTDLRAVVRQTVGLLGPMAERRRADVAMELDPEPAVADVDPGQVQQVLTNLVVNGIQAMPSGGRLAVGITRERVTPPADRGGAASEYLRVYVRDQGPGIAPEHLPHLFEPFFTTKPVGEGTGLGLSVSYGMVREHGGWIDVESAEGRGSCFSVYLPSEVSA